MREELRVRLEKIALRTNSRFDPPMSEAEVFGIVRSVCKYAYKWEGFQKQIAARRNGRKGGLITQRKRREKAEKRRESVEVLWMAGVPWRKIARIEGVSLRTVVLDIRVIKTGEITRTEWKKRYSEITGNTDSLFKGGDTVRFSTTGNRNSTGSPEIKRNLDDFPMGSPVWWSDLPSEGDRFRQWVLYETRKEWGITDDVVYAI